MMKNESTDSLHTTALPIQRNNGSVHDACLRKMTLEVFCSSEIPVSFPGFQDQLLFTMLLVVVGYLFYISVDVQQYCRPSLQFLLCLYLSYRVQRAVCNYTIIKSKNIQPVTFCVKSIYVVFCPIDKLIMNIISTINGF